MALQFDIKIFTKKVEPPLEGFLRLFEISGQNGLWNFGTDTTTGGDKAFVILEKKFFIDPGITAIDAFDKTQGT